ERKLEIVDRQMRQRPLMVPVETLRVPENCACSAIHSIGDIAAAVVACAGIGGEGVATIDAAAVRNEARDRALSAREQPSAVGIDRGGAAHVSSLTSAASGGTMTLPFGASGGAPSRRSADPITLAKHGAATLPP